MSHSWRKSRMVETSLSGSGEGPRWETAWAYSTSKLSVLKNLRFGMGLTDTRVSSTARRDRILCVAPWGVDSSVRVTTASTASSVILRGAPGLGSSTNPSRRLLTNRFRHLPTVGAVTRSCRATFLLDFAVAHARMISERNASPCAVVRRRPSGEPPGDRTHKLCYELLFQDTSP